MDQFREDEAVPFFVISLKAGGFGLNLTAASHVVHFDRWWNPAVENQATDRAFRIGQTKNVPTNSSAAGRSRKRSTGFTRFCWWDETPIISGYEYPNGRIP